MAVDRAVVVSRIGGLPELVEDGVSGLLVPPGDPSALAAAIGRALDDAELRARLAENGRKRVLEKFTWRKTAEMTVDHYREVLADHAHR